MSRTFTRAEFHELVWSRPMTQLEREFALSDVALHKICRKHNIPNPPLGWWARKAAGKAVERIPLPMARAGTADSITIAGGETRREPEAIAAAREKARLLASSIDADVAASVHPIVGRTIAQLWKGKPSPTDGLVSIDGSNVIKASVAPASIGRLELALARIVATAGGLGIELVRGETAVAFGCDSEQVAFSFREAIRRERHVLTKEEIAEDEAARRRRARRANGANSWDDLGHGLSLLRRPEWDPRPTGQLALELEQLYLVGGSPRRSFKDAKVQRLETMASDIAVGIAVLAAAKKADRVRREGQARQRDEE